MLAGIDQGGTASLADADVRPYDHTLTSLSDRCAESRDEIGDMSVATRKFLQKNGSEQSVMEVLRGLSTSVSTSPPGTSCQGMLALWASMVVTSGG